jgi:hypothetical protein
MTDPDEATESLPTHSIPQLSDRGSTTKVTVWTPIDPFAYTNALNASVFTRLAIKVSIPRLKLAVKRVPSIKQAFFLLHHNIALVFSQDRGKEHHQHVAAVTAMLKRNHMELDERGCYYNAETAEEAGFRLTPLDNGEAIVVVDLGLREEDEEVEYGEMNETEVEKVEENGEGRDEERVDEKIGRREEVIEADAT